MSDNSGTPDGRKCHTRKPRRGRKPWNKVSYFVQNGIYNKITEAFNSRGMGHAGKLRKILTGDDEVTQSSGLGVATARRP